MIRNMIPSDLELLNQLNKLYKWLPNSETIRPSSYDLMMKHLRLNQINNEWVSMSDYIKYKIFRQNAYVNFLGKKQIKNPNQTIQYEWVFAESDFKYNLVPQSNHWVLWSSIYKQNEKLLTNSTPTDELITDDEFIDEINKEIEKQLNNMIGSDNFNFAWYKNPKPTVYDFFHVQVFWIDYGSDTILGSDKISHDPIENIELINLTINQT